MRSKTIGSDHDITFRLVVMDAASYVQELIWLVAGWDLLCRTAPNERDYLLPSPTDNYKGCESTELSSGTACTIKSRIIAFLTKAARTQNFGMIQLRNSHFSPIAIISSSAPGLDTTGRLVMPSASDLLGGWGAEGSER